MGGVGVEGSGEGKVWEAVVVVLEVMLAVVAVAVAEGLAVALGVVVMAG